ncbi:GntP family permease [Fundicoccus culcitae]|uniref:GntP family permease n=1 Tax=Fundicoccus culcitae TaxID=2969821 RepID=A0ABY5P3W2_9LACT|nr:GntP family permease [Fundicoccus culcitae]UUX33427.1 GntP family permease [Fundicoccus culcitae]
MEILGSIGVLLGVFIIILLAVRGLNVLIAAPIATAVVVLFNEMNIFETLLGTGSQQFMGALGNYVVNFFAVFLLGSILAKLMEESGATVSIANYILDKFGKDKPYSVLVAIFIISAVLTYGGISLFVVMFAIIPLARSLFKKLDISWHLIQVPLWLGIATITMTMLPGTPAIQNVIPIQYLGTSLTAAPIPSILGSIGTVIFGLTYMRYVLNKSLAKGENYATHTNDETVEIELENLPSFASSIAPLLVLITIAITGSVFGNDFWRTNVIYFALLIGILLGYFLFRPYITDIVKVLNIGAVSSMSPLITTATSVAFGAVVMSVPGFTFFADLMLNVPGGPLVALTVLTAVMSGITGSTSGALGIVIPAYGQYFLDAGVHPEMIHRVASVGANFLTLVPHGGAMLTFLMISGLTHKNGFKDAFNTAFFGSLVAQVIIIISGSFIY